MISQTAEYALRAIVFLADQGEARTTQEIAATTLVPPSYLSKVMQALSRAGVVRSQRGLHGGFTLAKSPDELSVWDVIEAVDPIQRIRTCPLGLKAHGTKLCPLHRRLDDALALVENAFRESTVGDLLREPTKSKPLCDFPHLVPQRRGA
jgi:Rrf2 family transcriptional regulator, nitric oxide-sensitive transcriptional repressor